jgi:3-dehydroquinate synthase
VSADFVVRAGTESPPWRTRVVVGRNLLRRAADDCARLAGPGRIVVVSDARVARLAAPPFLDRLRKRGVRALLLTFPAGERSKTRETKARLENALASAGIGRDALLVAIGGGVTGDLAGFVAATWHRGVPIVQIPTSLLAMVDAALGGKTGVDVPSGKNLVGAFHQPAALYADLDVLGTLSDREYRCGLAEAVKTAVALDARLFARLERCAPGLAAREPAGLLEIVIRCLRWKGRVVAADEREAGSRAVLNLGHTVAHAVEAASRFRLRHGEAVAIGIATELQIAERLTGYPAKDTARVVALLRAFGLPTRIPPGLDLEEVLSFARRDKKARAGVVRCSLPGALGRMPPGGDPTVPVDLDREIPRSLRPELTSPRTGT